MHYSLSCYYSSFEHFSTSWFPNWLGAFSIDDSWNQNECCCLSEQAKITKLSDTQLLVSANVAGKSCPAKVDGSIQVPIPMPEDKDGFQIIRIFLGSLNRYVAIVNLQQPKCSGMGGRL